MKNDISQALTYTSKILDAWLPLKIKYDRIPGLSVGIVHRGKLVYKRGFGYADVERKRKATPETCYRIASISKVFTAVAILQLVERGKLRLDDPLTKYLPWFRLRSKAIDSRTITIRHVLSHSAGVFRDGGTPHWVTDKFPDVKELKKTLSQNALVLEPSTQFKYSNYGFALLGEVIKKVSGVNYKTYVARRVIQRLGLKKTWPDLTKDALSCLATGYSLSIPDKPRESFPHVETKAYAPAAGFVSNVIDLAKFLPILSPNHHGKVFLLSRELQREMIGEYERTNDEGDAYGLGIEIYSIAKRKIIGHGGGFSGFSTRIALDSENGVGVIVLSNTIGSFRPLTQGILETVYSFVDDSDEYRSLRKTASARRYEGLYRSRWGDVVIVSLGSSLLAVEPVWNSPTKQRTLLHPKGRHSFVMRSKNPFESSGEIAKFVFGRRGRKAKLIWGSTPLERVDS